MGRGSSGKPPIVRPAYLRETDKAVQLALTVEDYTLDRELTRRIWVPKSQLSPNGVPGQWITDQKAGEFYQSGRASPHRAVWTDANGKEYKAEMTAKEATAEQKREAAIEQGIKTYTELVEKAKAAGVKGIRVGMKRTTILKKIKQSGITI